MNKYLLFLPALALCGAAQGSEPALASLTEDHLFLDKAVMSPADTEKAIEGGELYCQTDNVLGSHIDTLTVCDLAKVPNSTGSHYRFIFADDGLHPLFCTAVSGCFVPPSVQAGLNSLQHLTIKNF